MHYHYHVAFDSTRDLYRALTLPAIALLFYAFREKIAAADRQYRKKQNLPPQSSQLEMLFNSVLFAALGISFIVFYEAINLYIALRSNQFMIVQGRVTQFVPMPYGGHADESFVVSGRRYNYSDYQISAAFNNTQSHGGPMREGLQVRITDVKGQIARLEIAE